MTWRDLQLRIRALLAPKTAERELNDELAFHVEMEARKHLAAGLSLEEARTRAQQRFGSRSVAAEACRDARGTTFIGTCLQDVIYAFRTFRRTPIVALTIVGTVALGLGLVAAMFTIFNEYVLRVDAVQDPGTLYAVERAPSGGSRFPFRQYEALRRETRVFSGVFARLMDVTSRIDGRMMEGQLVTGNFFQVLGVTAARGRTLTPADDALPVMVLSHSGWERLFSSDPSVLGSSVLMNGFHYEIVGITPEGFRGLSFPSPDYWVPLSQVGKLRPGLAGREDGLIIEIIGRLKSGLSAEAARAGLSAWAASVGRPASVRLQSRRSSMPLSPGVLLAFSPLFFAFGLILMIGCANVANLLLARAVSRQREIGIRLSLGASRRRVIRQLLTESLLLALAAAACAFAISRVAMDAATYVLMSTMPPELTDFFTLAAPRMDWRVAVFLVAAAIVSTVLFGLAPALQATRLELLRTMRGEVTRGARPNRARNALIVAQVTGSALLLICAGIFLRSALRAAVLDPGFRTDDNIIVEILNEPLRAAMVAAVTAEPSVTAVAASWPQLLDRPRTASASPAANPGNSPVAYRSVSSEYFSVLDIGVLRGRTFLESEGVSRAAVAVVSQATAAKLWPNADAIGQVLRLIPDSHDAPALPSQALIVVGIVRDVSGFWVAGFEEAGVYVPSSGTEPKTGLIARVRGDPELARRAFLQSLTNIDPNMGQVMTLRTMDRLATYPLQVGFWLTVLLGGLALLLTLSGIFSVLSYLVEQRTKEIGVRIAIGATTGNVTRMVLGQSLRLVGAGLAVGGALAWALAMVLMATPVGAKIVGFVVVDVFDPLAYIGSLSCIVTACVVAASIPALRAARINPIAALRHE